tara:strand:+ start:312 stop:497 length:186 start_codon:yes stop_codon:yes gene_type:complete
MPTLRLTRKRKPMQGLHRRAQGEKPMGGFGHGLWIQNKSAHGNELLRTDGTTCCLRWMTLF